jgi:hypothetical protein
MNERDIETEDKPELFLLRVVADIAEEEFVCRS